LAFELWFTADPKSKVERQLPANWLKENLSKYLIEKVSPNIIKINLKPNVIKAKASLARQEFAPQGEIIIPGLSFGIY